MHLAQVYPACHFPYCSASNNSFLEPLPIELIECEGICTDEFFGLLKSALIERHSLSGLKVH